MAPNILYIMAELRQELKRLRKECGDTADPSTSYPPKTDE